MCPLNGKREKNFPLEYLSQNFVLATAATTVSYFTISAPMFLCRRTVPHCLLSLFLCQQPLLDFPSTSSSLVM